MIPSGSLDAPALPSCCAVAQLSFSLGPTGSLRCQILFGDIQMMRAGKTDLSGGKLLLEMMFRLVQCAPACMAGQ